MTQHDHRWTVGEKIAAAMWGLVFFGFGYLGAMELLT